jgi:hypothetical protein
MSTGDERPSTNVETVDVTDRRRAPDDHSVPVHAFPVRGRTVRTLVAVVICGIAAARFFDVSLAGAVTNDSLGYLRSADAPLSGGIVSHGYRQAAYPVFVMLSNRLGDALGWDHIFGAALMQRIALLLAILVAIWALRWWSVPLVALLTSATAVEHSNLLLPEGLLLPLCLVIGALSAAVVVRRVTTSRSARVIAIAICASVVLAASLKLQYSVWFAVAVSAVWLLNRDGLVTRRFCLVAVGVSVGLVGALALAQSIENHSELGVFEPVSERARAEWYGAWQSVFSFDRDHRTDPALAEYWDDGNLYTFMHSLEARVTDYPTRARIFRERISAMFDAADTSARAEQLHAFVGALGMGRMDDLASVIDQAVDARDNATASASFNTAFRDGGLERIVDGYNDGHTPGLATFGPLLSPSQRVLSDHRPSRAWGGWTALIAMVLSLLVAGRHRLMSAGVLLGMAVYAAALASGYIDNARYLIGPYAIVLVGGTLAVRALAARVREIPARNDS